MCAIVVAGSGLLTFAQTQIHLQSQAKAVDFSAAQSTKPFRTGNVLPSICTNGEAYLLQTGPAGANIYTCTGLNMWVRQGGSTLPEGEAGQVLTVTGEGTHEWSAFSGDLSGGVSAKVTGLQNRPVADMAPDESDVLMWKSGRWEPAAPRSGAITIQLDGVSKGTHNVHNYVTGTGLVNNVSDEGEALLIQAAVNTAVVQTRGNAQSGADLLAVTDSSGGTNFTAAMNPTLSQYTDGMVAQFRPARSCIGSPTLDIDALGVRKIYEADGVTPAVCRAGEQYPIWYDALADTNTGAWRRQTGSSTGPMLTWWSNTPFQPGSGYGSVSVFPGSIALQKVTISGTITVNGFSIGLTAAASGSCTANTGIYTMTGVLLVGGAVPMDCSAGATAPSIYQIPAAAPVMLEAGDYYIAWAATTMGASFHGIAAAGTFQALMNQGQASLAFGRDTSAMWPGGAMPSRVNLSATNPAENLGIVSIVVR